MVQNSSADNWDDHWQELSKDIYFNTPGVKYRWEGIKKLLNLDSLSPKINLIDFGCGTGKLIEYFLNQYNGISVKGTDNSNVGLEIAKRKLPQVDFFQADLCSKQAEFNQSYLNWATHATCSEVLEHLDDPVLFLKNAGKFLRKGAKLVISVPGGPMSTFDHQVGHRKHYTRKILEAELIQAGYKVDKIACSGFPFHNLYRLAFILRGEAIHKDAKHQEEGHGRFVSAVMNCFYFLFKFNLFNSSFGWVILAKASLP